MEYILHLKGFDVLDSAKRDTIMNVNYDFFQEVSKNLNDYYYTLQDIVCIKILKDRSNTYIIEISIFNDEFDTPITMKGVTEEYAKGMIRGICKNILKLSSLITAFANDTIRRQMNATSMEYIVRMADKCVKSIGIYQVCVLAVGDMNLPEYDLNFKVVGNQHDAPIKNGKSLSTLALEQTIKELFPESDDIDVNSMIVRYRRLFREYCIVPHEDNPKFAYCN